MRAKGDGTISKRRKDGRYAVAYWHEGRRYYAYARSLRGAQQALAILKADLRAGERAQAGRLTLTGFLDDWLTGLHVSDQSRDKYAAVLRRYVRPVLGARRLAQLGPADIQTLYRDLEARGLAAGTVRNLHAVLHQALAAAVRLELLPRNPTDRVSRPRKPRPQGQPLTVAQAEQVLAAAATDPLGAAYVLALGTGMRQGEILALAWRDVDLAAGRLRVVATLVRIPGKPLTVGPPKTAGSRRTVLLAGFVVAALERHRASRDPLPVYVFGRPDGRLLSPQRLQESWRAFTERLGLPAFRFHDLRHTTATLLMARGIHPSIVASLLGHSSTALTLDTYSHATAGLQAEAVRALDALFGGH